MDILIGDPHITYDQAMEIHLKQIQPDLPDAALKPMIEKHRFTETNLCAMYRLEIVRALAEAGITVSVYGEGWDQTDLTKHPHFDLHSPVSFAEGLALMENSKIVLNQMAWFKDGGSERIFNAMLQGSVCVTDDSIYLKKQLTDGEDIVFYSLDALEKLPELVSGLLHDPDRMQRIADCGYNNAAAHHTWEHRAAELAKLL